MPFADREDVERFQSEQSARAIIGRAVAIPPQEMLELAGRPGFESMPYSVSQFLVKREGDSTHYFTLEEGIRNTAFFVARALKMHEFSGTFEEALPHVTNPRSLDTLAVFARGEYPASHFYSNRDSFRIAPNSTDPHIEALVEPPISDRACPAAGSEEDPTKPTPIFHKMGAWSGELALRTLYYNGVIEYPSILR